MHSTSPNTGADRPTCYWGFGPVTSTIIAGSGLSAAAFSMGAFWLGHMVAGLPLGAWLIASAGLAVHLANRPGGAKQALAAFSAPLSSRISAFRQHYSGPTFNRERIAIGGDQPFATLSRFISRSPSVRIGLDLNDTDRDYITQAWPLPRIGSVPVLFEVANSGLINQGPIDAHKFDALLRRGSDGELYLFVPSDPDHPAAWPEWSESMLLSYASVFPTRIDTSKVRLGAIDLADTSTAHLVANLAIAAAVTGLTPARLRGPSLSPTARVTIPNYADTVDTALSGLATCLNATDDQNPALRQTRSAAGRAVLAWLAAGAQRLPISEKMDLSRMATAATAHEAETLLRTGALHLSAGDEPRAMAAFGRAADSLSLARCSSTVDPVPFIMSEAELGNGDTLALGRICAGIVLAWSTCESDKRGYLREDLVDELSSTGWLSRDDEAISTVQRALDMLSARSRQDASAASAASAASDASAAPSTAAAPKPRTRKVRKAA